MCGAHELLVLTPHNCSYLACVGFEAQRGSGLTKVEYVSSWRRRLQQIRSLRQRIQESRGESPIVDAVSACGWLPVQ